MRLTIYGLFLLIFNTGYVFAVVHRDCGGIIDILRERSGYIRYSSPAGQVDSNSVTYYNETEQSETECTWIIDARPDQKVQLEIVSIDNVSSLWAHFENSGEQKVFAQKESSPFSGDGRTRITWKAKKYSDKQQSVNLFFTGRPEIRNLLEEGRGESARTAHPEHGESSSPHISGAPRVRRKSWPPASSGPAQHREGSAHHTEGPGGRGLGHGTVGTFPSLTSAPALGQSSSASAASDKEAPPLLQETANNNPDTSGAARGASHITAAPGLSTEGNGRGTMDPTGQRLQIWATEPEPEPEAHRFLEVSVDSRGRVTVGPPPKQDPDAVFQGPLTEPETKLTVLPPSPSAAGSAIPISVLPAVSPTVSPKMDPPGSMQPGQPADRTRGAGVGNPHISALPLHHPHSSASHPSGEVDPPSLTSPVDYPAALTPSDSNSPAVYLTMALLDPRGKDYTHRDYGLHSVSPLPGEGREEATGKQSVSNVPSSSTLGLSQEWKVLPHTGGSIGKGSWRVTDMDPPGSSLPEDSTYFDTEQGSHLDGTTGVSGLSWSRGLFRAVLISHQEPLGRQELRCPSPGRFGGRVPSAGLYPHARCYSQS
ncbi:hypothetical protein AGOR_G00091410 [Albula goreensis]|uniref:CUB domain-containing protein n=1 Tax=Albula goreensis TaxID=1534307 RepID=A0A8T3DL74_9TELE|nr:hypothetical protein AGOR_G00091410 [Albula goreensis]